MTEEEFLSLAVRLGVDRVRLGGPGDGAVYIYATRYGRTERDEIMKLAREVWRTQPILIVNIIPPSRPIL